jgi:hypothetical protein
MAACHQTAMRQEEMHMRKILGAILLSMAVLLALGQETTNKYEPATILDVQQHKGAVSGDSSVTRYDISLRVGKTDYVVLYTPPPGTYGAQYTEGMNLLVLVGSKTVTFNDIRGISREVPILSRAPAPPPKKP